MRQGAHFREYGVFDGEWYDELVFAVLADEWAQRRQASSEPGAPRGTG
jgi:RimJ/RimL family protein N-acetyltransferase